MATWRPMSTVLATACCEPCVCYEYCWFPMWSQCHPQSTSSVRMGPLPILGSPEWDLQTWNSHQWRNDNTKLQRNPSSDTRVDAYKDTTLLSSSCKQSIMCVLFEFTWLLDKKRIYRQLLNVSRVRQAAIKRNESPESGAARKHKLGQWFRLMEAEQPPAWANRLHIHTHTHTNIDRMFVYSYYSQMSWTNSRSTCIPLFAKSKCVYVLRDTKFPPRK
jgi:hypothetical protein